MNETTARLAPHFTSQVAQALSLHNRNLYVFAVLLSIAPLWFCKYLPMNDIPQHAAQITALHQIWAGDPTFTRLFSVNWFTPYLLGYMVFYPLSLVMPVTVAAKVVVSGAVVAIPLLTGSLLRAAGADDRWKWLAIPCSYSFAFYWGFLSFLVAAPLALLFLARTIRHAREPTPRSAVSMAAFAIFLFFCHVIVLGFASLIALAYIFGTSYRDIRGMVLRMLPYTAPLPLIAVWASGIYTSEARASDGILIFGLPSERLFHLVAQPAGNDAIVMPLTFMITGCVVLLPWLCGSTFSRQPQRWLPFVFALLVFLAAPHYVFGVAYFYQRLGIFLVPLWLLAWDAPQVGGRRLDWIAMLVVTVWVFTNTGRFAAFARETQAFDAAMATVEPGRRVASMVYDYSTPLFSTPIYMNFPAWYQATGRGVVDFNFADFFSQMVRYRPDAGPRMDESMAWRPANFDWNAHGGANYDYFIVKADADIAGRIFKEKVGSVQLVAHQGWWWLYRNNERANAHARDIRSGNVPASPSP